MSETFSSEDRADLEELAVELAKWMCISMGHYSMGTWASPRLYSLITNVIRYQLRLSELDEITRSHMLTWKFEENVREPGLSERYVGIYLPRYRKEGLSSQILDEGVYACFRESKSTVFKGTLDLRFGAVTHPDVDDWGTWGGAVKDEQQGRLRSKLLAHMGVLS